MIEVDEQQNLAFPSSGQTKLVHHYINEKYIMEIVEDKSQEKPHYEIVLLNGTVISTADECVGEYLKKGRWSDGRV